MPRPRTWIALIAVFAVTGFILDSAVEVSPQPSPLAEQESIKARIQGIREAFQSDGKPLGVTDPRLTQFFDIFTQAMQTKDPFHAIDHFQLNRLQQEILAAHVLPNPDRDEPDPNFLKKLYPAVWKAIENGWLGTGWQSTEIRRIEMLLGGQELIVYTRHRTATGVQQLRWWFVQEGEELFAYDVEDCRVGLRLSYQLAPVFAMKTTEAEQIAVQKGLAAIMAANKALTNRFPDAASDLLEPARKAPLPSASRSMLCLTEAAIALGRQAPADALKWADRTDAIRPGIPGTDLLRSVAHFRLKQWTEAVNASRRYVDLLGPDPQASYVFAASLFELGQRAEATRVLKTARQEFPEDASLTELSNRLANP